jgi:ParB family chromosome partitioning protein
MSSPIVNTFNLESHPAANAFPLLSKSNPERFHALVQNIRETGLVEPIVLYEGKVLDGRNRLLACKEAGVEPKFEKFVPNGVGPVQWIVAKNTRRDLTATQRAAAALALLPMLEAEAKERQGARTDIQAKLPERSFGQARVKAAGLTGASDGYVRDAKRIVEKDASMLERMRDGEITIQEAEREQGYKQTIAAINSDESHEWYTPQKYIEAARKVLVDIDLDPASCGRANEVVKAKKFYAEAENGLKQTWHGKIWLNPPYGDIGPRFVEKLINEYNEGRVAEAIVVLNAHATDTQWFQPMFNHLLCFTDHRPKFWNKDGVGEAPNHGAVFSYIGPQPDKFARVFSALGNVVHRYVVKLDKITVN